MAWVNSLSSAPLPSSRAPSLPPLVSPKTVTDLPTEQMLQVYSFFDLADHVGFSRASTRMAAFSRQPRASPCAIDQRALPIAYARRFPLARRVCIESEIEHAGIGAAFRQLEKLTLVGAHVKYRALAECANLADLRLIGCDLEFDALDRIAVEREIETAGLEVASFEEMGLRCQRASVPVAPGSAWARPPPPPTIPQLRTLHMKANVLLDHRAFRRLTRMLPELRDLHLDLMICAPDVLTHLARLESFSFELHIASHWAPLALLVGLRRISVHTTSEWKQRAQLGLETLAQLPRLERVYYKCTDIARVPAGLGRGHRTLDLRVIDSWRSRDTVEKLCLESHAIVHTAALASLPRLRHLGVRAASRRHLCIGALDGSNTSSTPTDRPMLQACLPRLQNLRRLDTCAFGLDLPRLFPALERLDLSADDVREAGAFDVAEAPSPFDRAWPTLVAVNGRRPRMDLSKPRSFSPPLP